MLNGLFNPPGEGAASAFGFGEGCCPGSLLLGENVVPDWRLAGVAVGVALTEVLSKESSS